VRSLTRGHRTRPALLALALAAGLAAQPAFADPVRRALLVGVDDYTAGFIPDLRGAKNDISLVTRVLETRMGFDKRNIAVLTDGQATRSAILEAIDDLVDRAGPDDVVYFHFSGHGSQVKDRNGDEPDQLDETIVAVDSRMPGVPDIIDDEIDRRFARIKTRNVMLVFDSCHSGTVTRSLSPVRPRSLAPDTREELYSTTSRAAVLVEQLPFVVMTSAPSDQEALDGPADGIFHGIFTYALARSLDELGPGAQPQRVHDSVKRELRRLQEQLHMQPPEPQLEAQGDAMQRPLLALVTAAAAVATPQTAPGIASATQLPAVPSRRAWLSVERLADGRVRLVDGVSLHGAVGSRWAIYGPGETAFAHGGALATGVVGAVVGRDAFLVLRPGSPPVPSGARAILVAPPDASEDLPLRFRGLADARVSALLSAIRGQVPTARAVGDDEFRRLEIELAGGNWRVLDPTGLRTLVAFGDAPDSLVAGQLASVIGRSARAMSLLSLDNPASELQLSVGVRTASNSVAATTRDIGKVLDDPAPAFRFRRNGEPRTPANSLVLEIQVDRPAYLTIVDVDAEGTISQLFPNGAQRTGFLPEGRVAANTVIRIPDALTAGNAAGFYWDYAPPAGTDTIRVFATSDLETSQTIRRFIAAAAADARAISQLRETLASTTTRGVRIVADDAAPGTAPGGQMASPATADVAPASLAGLWSAASLTVEIHE
jgi:hypothetical protein